MKLMKKNIFIIIFTTIFTKKLIKIFNKYMKMEKNNKNKNYIIIINYIYEYLQNYKI